MKKMHAAKEGDLGDLFYCHQKTTKFLLHTSYLCTELRITVTKASGKPTKNKVASTHKKLFIKLRSKIKAKSIQLGIRSCPKP